MAREKEEISEEEAKKLGLKIIEIIRSRYLTQEEKSSQINDLILQGADINASDEYGSTALHITSLKGHVDLANFLIEKGANLKGVTKEGFTPLHFAAKNNHLKLAKLLIGKGADLDVGGKSDVTALHFAASYGHLKIVELLIENMVNINAMTKYKGTALHLAIVNNHVKVAKLLIESNADLNAMDANGDTPLHLASQEGNTYLVKLLIGNGANVDVINKYGEPPLHLAAKNGYLEVVNFLIEEGADPTIRDSRGNTAGDHIGNEAIKTKIKALEEIYPKIKVILKKIFISSDLSMQDSELLNSLKNPENILIKQAFKGLVRSSIKDFIKTDKTDEIKKLVQFFEINKDLIDAEEMFSYGTAMDQYNYIKGIALREAIKNIGALKVVGSFLSSEDTKKLMPDIFHELMDEFKQALLKADFEKTSKIYHTMVRYDEKGILPSKGTIAVKEEADHATECGAGKGAGKEQDDSVGDRRSESNDTNHGGVEERKGEDGDEGENEDSVGGRRSESDDAYHEGVEERKSEDGDEDMPSSDVACSFSSEGNYEVEQQDNLTINHTSIAMLGAGAGAGAGSGSDYDTV